MGLLGDLGYNATSQPNFGSFGTNVLRSVAGGAALGSAFPGVGTLLGAGIGALGGIGSSLLGKKSQSDTNKAQMKLAEYEWQKNLEMWNLSNEYNSPIRQLERIRAAGLNPNLVYGGNSVGNSSGEAPRYAAPHLNAYTDYSGVGNAATTALNVAMAQRDLDMKDEQKRLLSYQADAMQQDSLKKVQEVANQIIRNSRDKFELDLASELRQTSLEAAQQGVNKIKQDIAESQSRVFKANAEIDRLYEQSLLTKEQRYQVKVLTAIAREDLNLKKYINGLQRIGLNNNSSVLDRLVIALFGSVYGEDRLRSLLDYNTH